MAIIVKKRRTNELSKDKHTAHSAMVTLRDGARVRRVVVLATPDAQSLEVAGPMEVFATANARLQEAGRERSPRYEVQLASTGEDQLITSAMSGLQLVATAPWNRLSGEIDTLLVVGGIDIWTGESNPELLQWLRRQAKQVRRLGSVCTGAFVLAHAGLLDGRKATTHWCFTKKLKEDYPTIAVDPDPIFIRDGNIVTAAGVASGIDLCLALVEEDLGLDIALRVARTLVLFVRRSGSDRQYSTALAFQNSSRIPLRELPIWIIENLHRPLTINHLASTVNMSVRNFSRAFAREFGATPTSFVASVRVDTAKRLLADSDKGEKLIAAECGFGSVDSMQRAFRQQAGPVPSAYRRRNARS